MSVLPVCMPVLWGHSDRREEEGAASPFPPELELQTFMSHHVHARDPAPRSSGRAANVPYHWAIAPAPTQNRI